MAFDSAEELSRRSPPGFWSMDNLETGIFCESKRVPLSHRLRIDDTVSKICHNQDLVRAWTIVFFFLATSGAAVVELIWR